jgi:predicted nucleic acid-binding protein
LQKVFGEVITTEVVAAEFGKVLPDWIKVESALDRKYQALLELEIDQGEASAIALSLEKKNTLLILDDLQARKLAKKLNLPYTGTLGMIARAKREGKIPSVLPVIEKIRKTNFRFSEEVYSEIVKAAGEGMIE